MAETSNIDSAKINQSVSRMQSEVATIQAGVQKFSDAVLGLDRQWTSDAKEAFMQVFHNDMEAMNEMVAQLDEYCTTLQQMAQSFDASESDILSKINSIR